MHVVVGWMVDPSMQHSGHPRTAPPGRLVPRRNVSRVPGGYLRVERTPDVIIGVLVVVGSHALGLRHAVVPENPAGGDDRTGCTTRHPWMCMSPVTTGELRNNVATSRCAEGAHFAHQGRSCTNPAVLS